jgi:hypothetical protein
MRSQEFVAEIERIPGRDYTGGEEYLDSPEIKKLTPLPGGSGLLYNTRNANLANPVVSIWDPTPTTAKQQEKAQQTGRQQPQIIAMLVLDSLGQGLFPIPNALQVNNITVHEDYRDRGIAKALYGIVLTIMKRPLVAGNIQTPGGRRNWLSLSQIPGVDVSGYVVIEDYDLDPNNDEEEAESMINTLMGRLGAQYIGADHRGTQRFFAFPVQPGRTGKELEAMIKTKLSRVYNENYNVETGLYAVWTGAA